MNMKYSYDSIWPPSEKSAAAFLNGLFELPREAVSFIYCERLTEEYFLFLSCL